MFTKRKCNSDSIEVNFAAKEVMTFCQPLGHREVAFYVDNEPTVRSILRILLNSRRAVDWGHEFSLPVFVIALETRWQRMQCNEYEDWRVAWRVWCRDFKWGWIAVTHCGHGQPSTLAGSWTDIKPIMELQPLNWFTGSDGEKIMIMLTSQEVWEEWLDLGRGFLLTTWVIHVDDILYSCTTDRRRQFRTSLKN